MDSKIERDQQCSAVKELIDIAMAGKRSPQVVVVHFWDTRWFCSIMLTALAASSPRNR